MEILGYNDGYFWYQYVMVSHEGIVFRVYNKGKHFSPNTQEKQLVLEATSWSSCELGVEMDVNLVEVMRQVIRERKVEKLLFNQVEILLKEAKKERYGRAIYCEESYGDEVSVEFN